MNSSNPLYYILFYLALLAGIPFSSRAVTFSLHEQGGLTGFVNGGGGSVFISPTGTDHWLVTLQDSRIGNPISAGVSLAYTEPETVGGNTAYNNIQVLSVVPGTATFDVLSDEISPYATIVADGLVFPIQLTDNETIYLKFTDVADTIPEPASASLLLCAGALVLRRQRRSSRT
jgi:hypothetical protein